MEAYPTPFAVNQSRRSTCCPRTSGHIITLICQKSPVNLRREAPHCLRWRTHPHNLRREQPHCLRWRTHPHNLRREAPHSGILGTPHSHCNYVSKLRRTSGGGRRTCARCTPHKRRQRIEYWLLWQTTATTIRSVECRSNCLN